MSNDAITLLHYASNAAHGCADDSDRFACWWSARAWAAHIIGATC